MKENILILHATGNNSQGNWYQWLTKKLENAGYNVWCPDLPQADFPNIKKYNNFIFENKKWRFDENSILIGHSSGAVAILGLLQRLPGNIKVGTCILVSAFKDALGWDNLDGLFEEPFDFKKIKSRAEKIIFIHSDNDPYCPLEHARFLAEKLGGQLVIKEGQGHFNLKQGPEYMEFPFLLDIVMNADKYEIKK